MQMLGVLTWLHLSDSIDLLRRWDLRLILQPSVSPAVPYVLPWSSPSVPSTEVLNRGLVHLVVEVEVKEVVPCFFYEYAVLQSISSSFEEGVVLLVSSAKLNGRNAALESCKSFDRKLIAHGSQVQDPHVGCLIKQTSVTSARAAVRMVA